MSRRNLDYLFRPGSVAVIGASDEPRTIGAAVMRNLLAGGFSGPILPVAPHHDTVAGVPAFRTVSELQPTPDLAVICAPPGTVPRIVADLAARGTRGIVLLTAGLGSAAHEHGRSVLQATLDEARPQLVRILGPESVGLLVPALGLNASLVPSMPRAGKIAFVSQSAALTAGLLDWAASDGIGFSHVVSLGDSADVDLADVLDYLGSDPDTRAVLLCVESVAAARKFMSAARAAARNKPVIVLKPARGRSGCSPELAADAGRAGADEVFDAAVRRAGMLRVRSLADLFGAAEALARARPLRGDRIAVVTNGRALGALAAGALAAGEAKLAALAENTKRALQAAAPTGAAPANPVDLSGDAGAEQYARTLQALLGDPEVDAVLLAHAPSAMVSSEAVALACVPVATAAERTLLSCWLGGERVAGARRVLAEAGVPAYPTPEQAARALLHLIEYRRNQEALRQTPPSLPEDFAPDVEAARRIVADALAGRREALSELEAKSLLLAYRIPVVETHRPGARLAGYSVQTMIRRRGTGAPRAGALELALGVAADAVFGPVIWFGRGGAAATRDRAVALPPLNMALAADLVSRSGAARLLAGGFGPGHLDALCSALVRLSQLVCDLPQVRQVELEPLFADETGVLAMEARVRIGAATTRGTGHLAIHPYPKELEESIELAGRRLTLRPIRGEDGAEHEAFMAGIEPDDLRFRFGRELRQLPRSELARMTQIDYEREMAFIATATREGGRPETVGEVRMSAEPDGARAEFMIVVRSDFQQRGLGRALARKMIRYCRARGIGWLYGLVDGSNARMLRFARSLGFQVEHRPGDRTAVISLDLQKQSVN